MAPVTSKMSSSLQVPRSRAAAKPQVISKGCSQSNVRRSSRILKKTAKTVPRQSLDATKRARVPDGIRATKRKRDHLDESLRTPQFKRPKHSRSFNEISAIEHWRTMKSSASPGHKRSINGSTISSDTNGENTREEKSAPYKNSRYEEHLQLKGFHMDDDPLGPDIGSVTTYKGLLKKKPIVPKDSLFAEAVFVRTCRNIHNRNEARVITDIRNLIVPSAEALSSRGKITIEGLIESVDEWWYQTDPITPVRPQPDYSVGYRRDTFIADQLAKVRPILGDSATEVSHFRATWYMYFPFLTCEVNCGAAALDIADRQNAHSVGIGVRAVVELFQLRKREEEVNRKILAFSISHDDQNIRIYGHYPVILGPKVTYHRHLIDLLNFQARKGRDRWTTYEFVKSIYDKWAPIHLKKIRSVLDELPNDISDLLTQSTDDDVLSQEVDNSHIPADKADSLEEVPSNNQSPIEPVTPHTSQTSASAVPPIS